MNLGLNVYFNTLSGLNEENMVGTHMATTYIDKY